jgi:hypothetical protein
MLDLKPHVLVVPLSGRNAVVPAEGTSGQRAHVLDTRRGRSATAAGVRAMNRGGILDAPGTAATKTLILLVEAVEAPGAPPVRARVLYEGCTGRSGGAGNGALTD